MIIESFETGMQHLSGVVGLALASERTIQLHLQLPIATSSSSTTASSWPSVGSYLGLHRLPYLPSFVAASSLPFGFDLWASIGASGA